MIPSMGESNVDGFADGELGLNFIMLNQPVIPLLLFCMHSYQKMEGFVT